MVSKPAGCDAVRPDVLSHEYRLDRFEVFDSPEARERRARFEFELLIDG